MRKITGFFTTAILIILQSSGLSAQNCIYDASGNNIVPDGVCAPVSVSWSVEYGGVIDGGSGDVSIYIDWDDGSPTETIPATNTGGDNWIVNANHVYSSGGDKCNYEPAASLVINGTLCTDSRQTQQVKVWDIDNENGGTLSISPDVFQICIGNDGSVQFQDASQWNCTPPYEEDNPNNRERWTQWIYGTGGTTITDATVNGTQHPWPYEGSIEHYTPTVTAPFPPQGESEQVYIPHGHDVGDYFEVTIRNWNTCNPYDDPDIPGPPADPVNGDNPPIETTAIALIVDLPDGSIDPVGPLCETAPPVTLSAATSGGTWSGPGVDQDGVLTPLDAGPGVHTIEYQVTDENGCSANGSTTIEVIEAPQVIIDKGNPAYLCPGLDLPLNTQISEGTAPYTIQWTGDTAPLNATDIEDPVFNTTNIGSYQITAEVTDANGCYNETSITIEVEDVSADFDPTPVEVCAGSTVNLDPLVSGGSTNYVAHLWSGPETGKLSATDIQNPDFHSSETGTFNYTYQVTDDMGCSDQTDIQVIVKDQPVANAGRDTTICALEHKLNGNSDSFSTSMWQQVSGPDTIDFDDPVQPDASITAEMTGTYVLEWTLENNGCRDSDSVEIIFASAPEPMAGEDKETCGLTSTLTVTPDLENGQWSLASGPGNVTFSSPNDSTTEVTADMAGVSTFEWTEISDEGCIGKASQTIEFMPRAIAQTAAFDTTGCSPHTIDFTNTSVNAENVQWNFPNGRTSSEENPSHVFEASGNTTDTLAVSLIATNSHHCNDTLDFEVIAYPTPSASFETPDLAGCSPLSATFQNTSEGAETYGWNFGDNSDISDEEHPEHTFENTEDYIQSFNTRLTATNEYGCTDQFEKSISVYPVRDIELTAEPHEGCTPLSTQLTTDAGAKEYSWDFGNGDTKEGTYQTAYSFENNSYSDTTYQVEVKATSSFGCREYATTTVTVHPSPKPQFEVTPMEQQMPDRTVTINNQTEGSWDYSWQLGDGSVFEGLSPATHQYNQSGDYEIILKAFSPHCEATRSKIISIIPMVPAIDYGESQIGCQPLTVSFYNNTLDATSYTWEFGDGNISQEKAPTHTYRTPGTYHVKLTATGPGGTNQSEDVVIEVYNRPVALFEPVPKVVYIPDESVNFLNKSEGGDFYKWSFGDGTTSAEYAPSHNYQEVGSYDVTLFVENNQECTDELTIPNAVKAEQGGQLDFPNAFTPSKSGPSNGSYTYGERTNHVFYPSLQKGIVEYKLQIYSRWGELIFESNDINKGWDGYSQKELCPLGVYIWRVTATFSNGKRIEKTGDVTLLR
ncbi:MAG: PKD domain-containing protein [Marinilabilia sp.]